MRVALALLSLRLKQARAGRLPWLALVHVALVGGVILLVPAPTPAGRLRLALTASLVLAGLVATLGGVAFGASLLPEDRESRRIHRLLSAPVSRGALATSTFVSSMLVSFALAVGLSAVSFPLVALAGDADARREVFGATVRIRATDLETAGARREIDGRVWIYGDNPAVRWTVPLRPEDLEPGDVHGEIRVNRRLDVNGALKDFVPVGVTVDGGEERIVRLGPDQPVPFTVPAADAADGSVRVVLRRMDPAYVLGVTADGLRLDGRRRFFLPELALAALGSGLVAALLPALGVAVSTVTSASVAAAAALTVGFIGAIRDFLISAAEGLRLGHGHTHGPPPVPSALDVAAARVVEAVAAFTPDLSALGLGGPLRDGSTATLAVFLPGLPDFLIGTALAFAITWALIRGREYP